MRLAIATALVTIAVLGAVLPAAGIPGAAGQNGSIHMGNIADLSCITGYTLFFPGGFGNILFTVYARLDGSSTGGISGAEFYIEGVEPLRNLGWSGSATPELTGAQVRWSFLAPIRSGIVEVRRGELSFLQCQAGGEPEGLPGIVPLFTVSLDNAAGSEDIPPDTRLQVVAGTPPANPAFPCSNLSLCDAPAFTKVWVPGGTFLINPTEWCTEAIAPTTWTAVKSLFRYPQ